MEQEQWYWLLDFPDLGSDPVGNLIQEMNSENIERRWKAAWLLGHFNDKRAVDSLIEGLEYYHDDPKNGEGIIELNIVSAWALGRLKDEKAVDALISSLSNEHPDIRFVSAHSLAEIGDIKAIEPLKKALLIDEFGIYWIAGTYYSEGSDNPAVHHVFDFIDKNVIFSNDTSPTINALMKFGIQTEEIEAIMDSRPE